MNEQLIQRIRQCPNLPSLPGVAIQVLDLVQRPDVEVNQIARIISQDAALASKVLRTVNSSFYARSNAVSTVSHALVIMGLHSAKSLVLGFTLVSNLREKGFKHLDYWRRSIYAATAARMLASRVGVIQEEEAFLAGLLADVGTLVLHQALGEEYDRLASEAPNHQALVQIERQRLELDHAFAAGILAEQWKLPPLLAMPIVQHHQLDNTTDEMVRPLVQVVHVGCRCADVFVEAEPAESIAAVRKLCQDLFNMDAAACDAMMGEIGARTKEVAPLFEIALASAADYEQILQRAGEAISKLGEQPAAQGALTTPAASAIQAAPVAAPTVQTPAPASAPAAPVAAKVTQDVLDRAGFDALLVKQFASAKSAGSSLSLLVIEIDNLAALAQQDGAGGPGLIESAGKLLAALARQPHRAASLGGEKLAMLLPGSARPHAVAMGEAARRLLSSKPIPCGNGKSIPITICVGVATFAEGQPLREPAHLLKAAELAMKAARQSGANCVRVFTLPKPATPEPAAA